MSRITDLTEKLPFWDKLSKEEREYVNSVSFLRRFEKDGFIHGSGNDCLGMFLVISGEIRTYLLSEEGREITLFRLYPNDICVLSASCVISRITFDTFMTAKQETEVLIVPANAIALLKDPMLVFFKDGRIVSTSVGYRPKDEILNELKLYMNQE